MTTCECSDINGCMQRDAARIYQATMDSLGPFVGWALRRAWAQKAVAAAAEKGYSCSCHQAEAEEEAEAPDNYYEGGDDEPEPEEEAEAKAKAWEWQEHHDWSDDD